MVAKNIILLLISDESTQFNNSSYLKDNLKDIDNSKYTRF